MSSLEASSRHNNKVPAAAKRKTVASVSGLRPPRNKAASVHLPCAAPVAGQGPRCPPCRRPKPRTSSSRYSTWRRSLWWGCSLSSLWGGWSDMAMTCGQEAEHPVTASLGDQAVCQGPGEQHLFPPLPGHPRALSQVGAAGFGLFLGPASCMSSVKVGEKAVWSRSEPAAWLHLRAPSSGDLLKMHRAGGASEAAQLPRLSASSRRQWLNIAM